jgi:hypothetical protein
MSTQALAYTNLQMIAAGAACAASGLELVVPNDAAKSLLFEKVESNPPCGTQMPYGCPTTTTPCLTTAQVQEIEDWINAGAMNN